MTKTKQILGVIAGAALALTVFVGALPNAFAADAPQNSKPGYRYNGMGPGAGMPMGKGFGNMVATVAEFLGIDSSKIIAERQAGKSMVQLAKDNGKSEDELYNYVFSQRKAQIEQLVASGRISAEAAAAHETIMQDRIKQNLNRTDVGPGYGKRGERNRGMGRGNYPGNCPGYQFNSK